MSCSHRRQGDPVHRKSGRAVMLRHLEQSWSIDCTGEDTVVKIVAQGFNRNSPGGLCSTSFNWGMGRTLADTDRDVC